MLYKLKSIHSWLSSSTTQPSPGANSQERHIEFQNDSLQLRFRPRLFFPLIIYFISLKVISLLPLREYLHTFPLLPKEYNFNLDNHHFAFFPFFITSSNEKNIYLSRTAVAMIQPEVHKDRWSLCEDIFPSHIFCLYVCIQTHVKEQKENNIVHVQNNNNTRQRFWHTFDCGQ